MQRKQYIKHSLDYLMGRPKTIWWKVVTGPPGYKLSILQEYDLVFDKKDCEIRKIENLFKVQKD
jgi:hypothetical protein